MNKLFSDVLVSVIIPTHNRSHLLKRAVESVLSQTYKNIELLICDDASSDNTNSVINEIIDSHPEKRIVHLRNTASKGACFSRNLGITNATGEFITALDDDDAFSNDRIETLLSQFDVSYSFICSNIKVIDSGNEFDLFSSQDSLIENDELLWNNVVGNQVLTLKSRLIEVGMYDTSLSSAQDYDLWLRLVQKYGPCYRIGNPSYFHYRDHDLPRITTSNNKLLGMKSFLAKHDKKMSFLQAKYHTQRIAYWENNQKLSISNVSFIGLISLIFGSFKYYRSRF
ncbi:glycosyltransferase [Vibrio owensii]|uniref:glycosyltransferase n=1 Tax=Vibrio owensii TaxID=696485 RepID=UPI002FF18D12